MKRTQPVGKSKCERKTKMKVYNSREARKIARKNGWELVRVSADHYIYKHPNNPKILTITCNNLNRMVWERCVREYNLNLNV